MLDWSKYITVANKLQHKAKLPDRQDLNHTILLSLADAQSRLDNNGGGKLSDIAMLRIASYQCQKYWRTEARHARIVSLNAIKTDGDGNATELIDTIADDKAIDLSAWLDAKTFLLGYPKRLVEIARKRVTGLPLNKADQKYLERFRRQDQIKLPDNVAICPSQCPVYSGSPV